MTCDELINYTESFHKELDRGEAGDNMGALLRGIKREDVQRGQVLVATGSIKAVKTFQAQIYVCLPRLAVPSRSVYSWTYSPRC